MQGGLQIISLGIHRKIFPNREIFLLAELVLSAEYELVGANAVNPHFSQFIRQFIPTFNRILSFADFYSVTNDMNGYLVPQFTFKRIKAFHSR